MSNLRKISEIISDTYFTVGKKTIPSEHAFLLNGLINFVFESIIDFLGKSGSDKAVYADKYFATHLYRCNL